MFAFLKSLFKTRETPQVVKASKPQITEVNEYVLENVKLALVGGLMEKASPWLLTYSKDFDYGGCGYENIRLLYDDDGKLLLSYSLGIFEGLSLKKTYDIRKQPIDDPKITKMALYFLGRGPL